MSQITGPCGPLFDPQLPTQRIVWDASTLSALARNPFGYYWQYVRHRRLSAWATMASFGSAWHTACEYYWMAQQRGNPVREAWDAIGDTVPELAPGGAHSAFSLLRALVWYDRWNAKRPEPLGETIAIEQPFRYPVPDLLTPSDGQYWLAGRTDQVVRRPDGSVWIVERKTGAQIPTAHNVLRRYRTQCEVYLLHGQHAYGADFGGICIDALQTAVTFNDFGRFDIPVEGSNFDAKHTWETIKWRIRFSEWLARENNWNLAARLDDPYAPRELADVMSAHPQLWDRLMHAATVPSNAWYPGGTE